MARIIRPALAELAGRGTPFRGILFAGLMLTADGPKLIEFNVRLGDPEAQTLLPRLRSDLLPALLAACEGELGRFDLRWRTTAPSRSSWRRAAIRESLARQRDQGPRPPPPVPGREIFHGGTRATDEGRIIAAGGRVLTVSATGASLGSARAAAYAAVARIDWPDGFCRRDIGWRALAAAPTG